MTPRVVNLTGHEITLYDPAGEQVVERLAPAGRVWITEQEPRVVGRLLGLPVVERAVGRVEGLPVESGEIVCVVPLVVLQHPACAERWDLVSPDTSKDSAVRRDGQVVGVRGFTARSGIGRSPRW